MKKVIFLGSKKVGFNCLQYLVKNAESLNIQVIGVLSKANDRFPEIDLISFSKSNGIRVFNNLDELLLLDEIDFIISVQHHEILKQQHINRAKVLAINLHMAPLPEYRGCNQFSFAIVDGKQEFGTTLHKLESGIDSGPIIAEKRFKISDNITIQELYDITEAHSIELFESAIGKILNENFDLLEQETRHKSHGTSLHFRKEIEQLKIINPDWPDEMKKKIIRATAMPGFEPPYSIIEGKKLYYSLDANGEILTHSAPLT
jgi:methionyl-tRNA formyltransferase